jgi:hypothetical protein
MRLLFDHGKMHRVCSIAMMSIAFAPFLRGQEQSLREANAVCSAGFDGLVLRNAKPKDYAVVSTLRQQRERNQSKIAIGMSREEVLQLLSPPDFAHAAWLDSAETFCIWSYDAIPESYKDGPSRYRTLDISMNLKHRVNAIQFKQLLSINALAPSGDKE